MAFARATAGSVADINITPLVDVLLVLLVIFMLATPVITRDIGLDLPQTDERDRPPPPRDVLQLRIDSGAVFWDGRPLAEPLLSALLQQESQRDPQPLLSLQANADASYQQLTQVLALARNAGMRHIAIADSK